MSHLVILQWKKLDEVTHGDILVAVTFFFLSKSTFLSHFGQMFKSVLSNLKSSFHTFLVISDKFEQCLRIS